MKKHKKNNRKKKLKKYRTDKNKLLENQINSLKNFEKRLMKGQKNVADYFTQQG
jgi:hypothetical protein